ncbi:Transposase [Actinopolymorpha singaporensis]|uniref:Transposase n=1 Tax=Actinopolymorpha singaporensis TaxID=117157 RepID=A0A1H1QZ48_9ACTN|nr:Transposase [Actinopolymorpha singaporensis]
MAHLPGLAMRRIADLPPGAAKTDARDAYVIADAARTLPHTLRRVDTGEETLAELEVLVGYDDDLAGEATRLANRTRGLLTQIQPALERVLGPKVQHPAVLELLARCGGPIGLRNAGRRKLTSIAVKNTPQMGAQMPRRSRPRWTNRPSPPRHHVRSWGSCRTAPATPRVRGGAGGHHRRRRPAHRYAAPHLAIPDQPEWVSTYVRSASHPRSGAWAVKSRRDQIGRQAVSAPWVPVVVPVL